MSNHQKHKFINTLLYEIRRQLALGIHTMSICNVCNKQPARGEGPCGKCVTKELEKLVGKHLAEGYYTAINKVNTVLNEIHGKVE